MRLGYACMNATLQSKTRTCRLSTYQEQGDAKVKELTLLNLQTVFDILQWNVDNNIYFFRISSEIVPLGSHPSMTWQWFLDDDVNEMGAQIRSYAERHHIRLSVHPGQYTIINSPKQEVVNGAIAELEYHDRLMTLLGAQDMILHVGGAYGDKEAAINRFVQNFPRLSDSIQGRLRVENDDKIFHVEDVLRVAERCGVPVCFDIHHHKCNLPENIVQQVTASEEAGGFVDVVKEALPDTIQRVFDTWKGQLPKFHISSGKASPADRSHHNYVHLSDYLYLKSAAGNRDFDLMLEAKLKDQAVLQLRKELEANGFATS